jgi:hypothetical protein
MKGLFSLAKKRTVREQQMQTIHNIQSNLDNEHVLSEKDLKQIEDIQRDIDDSNHKEEKSYYCCCSFQGFCQHPS